MMPESARPARRRRWLVLILGGVLLGVLLPVGIRAWQADAAVRRCEGTDRRHVAHEPTRLCYSLPWDWSRIDEDADADEPGGRMRLIEYPLAEVYAVRNSTYDFKGDRSILATVMAEYYTDGGDSRPRATFSEKSAQALTVDGRPGGTATIRVDFPDNPSGGSFRVRLTYVDLGPRNYSMLYGIVPDLPELRQALDEIHDSLTVFA